MSFVIWTETGLWYSELGKPRNSSASRYLKNAALHAEGQAERARDYLLFGWCEHFSLFLLLAHYKMTCGRTRCLRGLSVLQGGRAGGTVAAVALLCWWQSQHERIRACLVHRLLHHQVSSWARNSLPRLAHAGNLPSRCFAEEKEAGLHVYLNNKAWVVYEPASRDPWADWPLEKPVWLGGPSWWNLQVSDAPQCNTGGWFWVLCYEQQWFLASPPSLYKHVGVKRDIKVSIEWVSCATHPSLLEEQKPILTKKNAVLLSRYCF